jgi:hypothetical protein
MAPKKQVSPAIRILRGERDASARATHLEAATRKFLVSTNERKQMSSKTNFKRIALVAVAALGLGVLSSVPSQAAVTGVLSVTATNGTATTSVIDSTTAGTLSVRWLQTGTTDSVSITTALNSQPTDGGSPTINFFPVDTLTSISLAVLAPASRTGNSGVLAGANRPDTAVVTGNGAGYVAGKFKYQLDTTVGIKAGTYTFTLTLTPFTLTAAEPTKVVTQDVSIVVSAIAAESTTASSVTSTSLLSSTVSSVWQATATDSIVAALGTASSTSAAAVRVTLLNADSGTTPKDSLTVSIDKGNLAISTTTTCATGATGKSLVYAYSAAAVYVCIYPDGTTGVGTVTIATKNAGTFTESLSWYGTDVKTITASARLTVIGATETAGTSNAIRAQAFDASSVNLAAGATLYSYSSDTTIVSNDGAACGGNAYSTSDAQWYTYCPLTVVSGKSGTVTITVRNAATVALSTVSSTAVSTRVSTGVASAIKLTTDKATYAPGEKGYVMVTVLDAAGLVMPKQASTTTLASGGVYTNGQLGAASDTMTATAFATDRSSSGANAPSTNDPVKFYVFYAPTQGGSLTFSAKGASTFSAASQATAATATITVTDNAAAALAAVTALATTVASLKTLITTLTNLVLKIQKKVKA